MNKEDLIKNVAKTLGASDRETTIAFDIFLRKVSESLNAEESLRVPGIGIFQLSRKSADAKEQSADERQLYLNYVPSGDSGSSAGKSKDILSFPVARKYSDEGFDENVFSLSVDKPLIPVGNKKKQEFMVQSSYLMLQKEIEDKTDGLIDRSARMNDFKISAAAPLLGTNFHLENELDEAELPWDFGSSSAHED
ncbi:MAG: HU family DNA-binding protein, partial [Bacteroidota bacterium]|nr:HU family DNA-binding protein [Bacteroidota bacterium]